MKKLIVILFLPCILVHCTGPAQPNEKKKELYSLSHYQVPVEELSDDQQSAFDALNKLQISTDQKNKLYSTFANIEHNCYPPDSTFEISQSDLLIVMQKYISEHCTNLEPEMQIILAKSSVLAQDQYSIFYCKQNSEVKMQGDKFPMNGTWIFPSVLGRRDLILNW